jgi:hypothetical protein
MGTDRLRRFIGCDLPDGLVLTRAVQSPLQKYFHFLLTQITSRTLAVLPHRGAYRDRHGRGAGCGGRESSGARWDGGAGWRKAREQFPGAQTNGALADGKIVWS